jgi:hypothetical protein
MLIGCLCSRNPLFVNNIHGIKETQKHEFHFWLGHTCFLWHSKLWRLVSGSYGKNKLSTPLINRFFNCGSASTFSKRSAQTLNRASRCCYVRFLDTILAQSFLIPNSSASVKRTVSWFMSTSSAVVLSVHLLSDRTSSLTLAALSPVRVADGRPLRCSSPTRVPPS